MKNVLRSGGPLLLTIASLRVISSVTGLLLAGVGVSRVVSTGPEKEDLFLRNSS